MSYSGGMGAFDSPQADAYYRALVAQGTSDAQARQQTRERYGISQSPTPQSPARRGSPEPSSAASEAYRRGVAATEQGRFADALREFTTAYNLAPAGHAGRRINLVAIGVSLYKLGRFQDAIHRFERYLREGGQPVLRDINVPEAIAGARRLMGPGYHVADLQKGGGASASTSTPSPAAPPPGASTGPQTVMRPPPNPYARRASIGVWVATGLGVAALAGLAWWRLRS